MRNAMAVRNVSTNLDSVRLEKEILEFWDQARAFETLRELREGGPLFNFVDGPITANNPMGVHHAWGRTLKDAFLRYRAMQGHSLKYQNGFDCQGLWVEVEVEKALGFQGKQDIERFGLDEFSRQCRQRVETFSKVITEQSIRLGQWMDWDHSYYTHDDSNIAGIWHFLRVCHENGWLYRKGLPMPWCPRCGTSLSEHEMAGSYREMEHLSLFVRAPLKDGSGRRLLLWTTTPWTLTANVAAAVNPKLTYCEVSSASWDHKLILCKSALGVLAGVKKTIDREFPGSELVGLEYETFFPDLPAQANVTHRVIPWEAVDAQEGSGIVHIAPGCGREDFELGKTCGLPAIVPIDERGTMGEGFGEFAGQFAGELAHQVSRSLAESGKLLKELPYTHSYPVCWRCKGELLFRLVDEWFIGCEEVRPRMIAAARAVEWTPEYTGKRMEDWLNNMGDWCISRKRYWGLPLPFYPCKECGHLEVVGSVARLRELAVDPAKVDALPELHRSWIDEVQIRCPKCDSAVSRVVEVGDCWLDAGIVPYSTLGYFDDPQKWESLGRVEWVCEMREQVRLWFYSMLFMGVTLSDRAPYKRVLGYERVVAEDGTMFSKTGFMIRFDEAVERVGADVMRYLYCRQPVSTELRFGYGAAESARRKLADLWNIYAFFTTYASIDKPDLTTPERPEAVQITDRWLRARTARMLRVVKAGYEAYDTPAALREVEPFLEDVSTWYVRVSRRRFWRDGEVEDKRACYGALLDCLRATALALAPMVPFVTEEIWQNAVRGLLPDAPASVHHALWPEIPAGWEDEDLLARTDLVRRVISLALNLRSQASLRVRQPLPELLIVATGPEQREALQEQLALVKSELNVKAVSCLDSPEALLVPKLALKARDAGPVLRGDVGKVKGLVEHADHEAMAAMAAAQERGEPVEVPGYDKPVPPHLFNRETTARPGLRIATEEGLTVALDTRLTDDLKHEGLVRDLVRNVQVLRKDSGLAITQRIELGLEIADPALRAAVDAHRSYIADELLAVRIEDRPLDGSASATDIDLDGTAIRATLRPVEA